jgi:SecD/SecF fusion protein
MGAVLTLPGIAGIVLSMGMAVDCNVLIYERIKEEMEKTADKAKAISDGFTHAYSSIIDSQATTFITGLILFSFGTGPILGFATTLMLGIVTSLFTGILVSRLIMEKLLAKGQVINFIAEGKKGLFHGANYNILGKRKYMYIFSSVFIIIGIVSLFTNGLNYGVDFKGGRTYTIQLPVDKEINSEDVRKGLNEVFAQSSPEVKTVSGFTNRYKVATKEKIEINSVEADQEVAGMVYDGLKTFMGSVTKEDFVGSDKYIIESRKVGPTIVDDIKWGALQAVFWSILAIGVYLLIRFKRWYYSMGAALALFHDVFFIVTLYTVLWKVMPFSLEVDQNFIAAILTIIGYSVNDTVVVFDRLREYLRENSEEDAEVVINRAMNSTLSRTIITVLTVLLTSVILLFFGGEALRGFSFSLTMGLIIGTYSSVFIASALVLDLSKRFEGGKVKE